MAGGQRCSPVILWCLANVCERCARSAGASTSFPVFALKALSVNNSGRNSYYADKVLMW